MVNYKLNQNVFREYDIRGIVDQDFPKEFIIPNDSRINKLMERNIDENNLKYYYLRRDGKVYI